MTQLAATPNATTGKSSSPGVDEVDLSYPPPPKAYMTEEEFVEWVYRQDEGEYEWVDGKVVPMSPVSLDHDDYVAWIRNLLNGFAVAKKLGQVAGDGVQVRFNDKLRRQPDVKFFAHDGQATYVPKHIEGAPELCVEVVSADDPTRDYVTKFREYEREGVREYWIVDPLTRTFTAWSRRDAAFERIEETDGKVQSAVLVGLYVRPEWLTKAPLPNVNRVLVELGIDPLAE